MSDTNQTRRRFAALVGTTAVVYGVVEAGGETYDELYFLTERFEYNRDAFERILDQADVDDTDGEADDDTTDTETGTPN